MDPLKVEGGKGTVELGADGVIRLVWKHKVTIEELDAQAAMRAVDDVGRGSRYPIVVDMASTEYVSRQARAVFPSPVRLPG